MKNILIISLILLTFCAFSQNQLKKAPLNPAFIKYMEAKKNGTLKTETKDGHKFGYIPSPVAPKISNANSLKKNDYNKSFPVSYDMRTMSKLTSVKDQGQCGSCWAFATLASIESRWRILGYGIKDLSEDNLNNCHRFDYPSCEGGNIILSTSYMSNLQGPIAEADDKYYDTPGTCPTGLTPQSYVTDARFLPIDINAIKQALMDYGALYTSYYHDDIYYNASNYTYYCSDASLEPNHAVTIVGWDDNKQTSGGKGAWIIKNSWSGAWGESGFFYMSYNDAVALQETSFFPNRIDYVVTSKLYHYDELGWTGDWGYDNETAYALVKFVTSDKNPISKIATWINTENTTIDIEVYDNFDGTKLTSSLGSLTNVNCIYSGYYTFDLPTPITMANGNDFYIKIKYNTPGNYSPIPVEEAVSGFATPSIQTSGKCWTSADGKSWDQSGSNTANVFDLCIKAYSSNSCIPPAATTTPAGTISGCNGNPVSLTANSGQGFTYQWQKNGIDVPGATNISYNVDVTGAYTVVVTDSKDCFKASLPVNASIFTIDAGPDVSISCNDSINLSPVVDYPSGSIVKLYKPKSVDFYTIGPADFGSSYLNSIIGGNVIYAKDLDGSYIGCASNGFKPGIFNNKIALIDRGTCNFSYKAYEAQVAGAKAVIIVNNVAGGGVLTSMAAGLDADLVTVPVIMLSYEDGAIIKKTLADSGYAKLSMGYDGNLLSFKWSPADGLDAADILNPVAKPGITTTYTLSVTTESCTATDKVVLKIANAPIINLGKDTTITIDKQITLNAGIGYKSYLWSDNSKGQTLTLTGATIGAGQHSYSVTVTDIGGCKAYDEIKVNVLDNPGFKISGTVNYNNSVATPIKFATVSLKNIETNAVQTTTSNAYGIYTLDNVKNGNYLLSITNFQLNWGGGDPVDAYLINAAYLNSYNFKNELCRKSADVTANGSANPQSALTVNKRYMNYVTAFKAGDWLSESISITVKNSNILQNVKIQCFGDVDASYKPAQ